MRDPKLYSEENRWNAQESELADEFVTFVKNLKEAPDLTEDEIDDQFRVTKQTVSKTLVTKVLERMKLYPHMFEIAAAKNSLNTLNLDGTLSTFANLSSNAKQIRSISLNNFTVRVEEYLDFLETRKVSHGLFEHLLQAFRRSAPCSVMYHKGNFARANKPIVDLIAFWQYKRI